MSTSSNNHDVIYHVHEYDPRSDSAPTATELTIQARVGLALGILGAIMLTIILTTLIVLRIQRGPSITLRTLFSRKPIPPREGEQGRLSLSPSSNIPPSSDEESQPPPAYTHTHPLSEPIPGTKGDSIVQQPQQAHLPPSLRKELNLHIDTSHTPTTAIATTKPKPTPLRTMSDTAILRSSSSEKDKEARSTLEVQIHHHPYYNRLRTGSPRSPAGSGSGNRSDRLCPPDEYAVPPDSPDVIVLPSPRELQKFRINVYR
ncbi:uncharacterized protein AlacWU_10591 [Aspergillus niger]|uniref:uncharacterized protein n=1 Tax=Aspergillus lacticoffeatus (strain CBS 101883) TaxID=1450533 RepID=UPI000D8034E9|nr:uncharacterized protein BO96DRAFT_498559 [Aspergillus niger CBS 101883]PYH58971.1 hypothetical protein BO96DRAFT_498559 [Aspergillus niger CBS 101883]GJP97692.1 uncharacterized protein AlacWU_10591 [Aspergillus niger]